MLSSSLRRLLIVLIAFLAIWLSARFLLPIAAPFLFAAILALIAEPLVRSLQRHFSFSRTFASGIGVSVVLVLTILLFLALCALLIRQLGALAGIVPDLENTTSAGLNSLESWLLGLAQKSPDGVRPIITQGVTGIFSNSSALLDGLTSRLLNLATSLLKALPDSALGLGTWVLAAFMISSRLPKIKSFFLSKIPPAWQNRCVSHLCTLKKSLLGWLLAQAKLVGITFAILFAGFFLLQIQHPLLWAIVVCLVDILPVLGTGTVLIPWSAVCFLQGDTLRGIGLLGMYAVIFLLRSALEPRFVGKELGLDPLITLLSIYAGYRLWGLPGMLIAPVLAVIATQILLTAKKQP